MRFPGFEGEWKYSKIEDFFEFKNGLNKEKEFFGKGTPIITFTDVYKLSSIKKKDIRGLVELNDSERERFSAKIGDVFFTRTSETIDDIGMTATLVEEINDCVFSGFVLRARPKNSDFFPKFTSYLFSVNSVRKEIVTKSSMTTRALTSGTLLNKVNFTFPDNLNEQTKIASFLTKIEERIQTQNKIIEDYQLLKKGTMQKLFKQELRFKNRKGALYSEWEKKKMSQIAIFFSGGTPKSSNTHFYNGDIPFIGSGDISKEKVENFITKQAYKNSSAKMVEGGDILYALYGATSGEVALSKIKGAINQAVLCIKTEEVKIFIVELLKYNKSKIVSKYLQGGQGNLSAKIVKDLKFYIPSVSEQKKIANTLSAIDAKIALETKLLDTYKLQKKYLLQNLFI